MAHSKELDIASDPTKLYRLQGAKSELLFVLRTLHDQLTSS